MDHILENQLRRQQERRAIDTERYRAHQDQLRLIESRTNAAMAMAFAGTLIALAVFAFLVLREFKLW